MTTTGHQTPQGRGPAASDHMGILLGICTSLPQRLALNTKLRRDLSGDTLRGLMLRIFRLTCLKCHGPVNRHQKYMDTVNV